MPAAWFTSATALIATALILKHYEGDWIDFGDRQQTPE